MLAISAHPDFAVLGYPVITLEGESAHAGSRKALLGENPDTSVVHENSLQNQVKTNVPPVFMFHGVGDQAVPVTNSLMFFNEVLKYNEQSETTSLSKQYSWCRHGSRVGHYFHVDSSFGDVDETEWLDEVTLIDKRGSFSHIVNAYYILIAILCLA